MLNRKRVTLADIARRCGVSLMTVSLALRGRGSLAKDTRARIKAVAEQLGYAPDPALAALVHYRTDKQRKLHANTLAYLTSFPTAQGWKPHYFYLQSWLGATERAARLGYRLDHFWATDPKVPPARLGDILKARGIQGVVVAPLPRGMSRLNFPWQRFAAVATGPSLVEPLLHTVANNHYQGMQLAMERLTEVGYRRIGLVLDESVHRRLRGQYLAAFQLFQLERVKTRERVPPLRETSPDDQRLVQWLQANRPDVVLYHDDRMLDRLRALRVRVPDDVGFASLGKLERPEITGVDLPPSVIGAAAIDRVDIMLRDGEVGIPERPLNFFVHGVWAPGLTAPGPMLTA